MSDIIQVKVPNDIVDISISEGINLAGALKAGDNVSLLTNDAGYLVPADITNFVSTGDNVSVLVNDSGYLASGANISLLTNDAGYITSAPVTSVAGKTGVVTLVKADITDFVEGDYATAAQGTLADSALQSGANISLLTNDSGFITSAPVDSVAGKTGVVTLVKADITDFVEGDYATAAQGTLADSALQSGANISLLTNDSGYITSAPVTSVSGKTGVVTLVKADITDFNDADYVPIAESYYDSQPHFELGAIPHNTSIVVNQTITAIDTPHRVSWGTYPISEIPDAMNMFEMSEAGVARYLGDRPFYLLYQPTTMWFNVNAGAIAITVTPYRNFRFIGSGFQAQANSGYGGRGVAAHTVKILCQKYDKIGVATESSNAADDPRMESAYLTGMFHSWVSNISLLMGAEEFINPTITGTTGFTGNSATLVEVGGVLTATSTATASTLDAAFSGLTIGKRYRCVIGCKRGVQGTEQQVLELNGAEATRSIDYYNLPDTYIADPILTTSEEFHVVDFVTTATSGYIRFQINATGAIGDELVVTEVSVKEYL